jgi:tetratricopeptide (TPR) repeat protein
MPQIVTPPPSYAGRTPMPEPMPTRIQRFEVRELLGSGGMGTVFRAFDPQLQRDVAVKLLSEPSGSLTARLSPQDTLDLRAAGRASQDDLLREARMMAQLSHPNVLPVYEVGLADRSVFVVMEHIAGCDLATWLATKRTTAEILDVLAQAARGLAAAHARGIVHRDFKPANVLVGDDGRVRVADFGLSRMSKMTSPGMVRIDDGRGTPRYMAPELWRGETATAASDVFALCVAIDEALGGRVDETAEVRDRRWRERQLSARLRAALASGLAAEPGQRCDALRLVDALAGTPPAARRWIIGGGAAALALAGAALAFTLGDEPVSCDVEPAWLDPARRVRLLGMEKLRPDASGVVAAIEERERQITAHFATVCDGLRAGKLTEQQALVQRSCLQRRIFELDATVDGLLANRINMIGRVTFIDGGEPCAELVAPALPGDRAAAAALWTRLVRADELATSPNAKPHEEALVALERDARAAGEHELAMRAAFNLGRELEFQDRLDEADAAFQRGYRGATDMKAVAYSVFGLLERSRLAATRNDGAGALNFAQLAADLANTTTTTPIMRAQIGLGLGAAASAKGDYRRAAEHYQRGIDALLEHGRSARELELDLRVRLVTTLSNTEGSAPRAVATAKAAVERAKILFGEQHTTYGLALNSLAFAMRANADLAGALPVRRRALDVYTKLLPADHSSVVFQHIDYAADLLASGKAEEAVAHYQRAYELSNSNQRVRAQRAQILAMLALNEFELGRHADALAKAREAVEISITDHGIEHPRTQNAQATLLDVALELDLLDEVERTLASLERVWRAKPEEYKRRAAYMRGVYAAELAIRRGKAKHAEQVARAALATLVELGASHADTWQLVRVLGESLLAQRRYREAHAELTTALAWAREAQQREDQYALVEIAIARVEAGQGQRTAAQERARAARAVLDKYPGQLVGRRHADQLLGVR